MMSTTAPVIHADNIHFEVPELTILNGISLEVQKQESIVILGPSGSGKSAFIKVVCGLQDPTAGSVRILGQNLLTLNKKKRLEFTLNNVGYVFQDAALISNLDVFDNIALPLQYHALYKEDEIENRVLEIMERFQLMPVRHQFPATLSLGQRKFVAFARAILIEPEILILDEPTASVDIHSADVMVEMVKWYNIMGGTIISITHDMFYANAIASKMGIIHRGRLLEYDSPSVVKTSMNNETRKILRSVSKEADLADELLKLL
jgi:ABC-type transporter Mla maintaining outer membrane lipid asymmetry ATPase subunit MlaF